MSYLDHWRLREKPFEEVCDTRFFFESEDHREALDRMLYVVNDRNMKMGLLTGEIGSGKTLTKNVFLSSLPTNSFEYINFENSSFSFCDLLFDIIKRLSANNSRLHPAEQVPRNDKYALIQLFKQQLETLYYEDKRHCILIFDEAQQIDDAPLDELKNLTNIATQTENFLTIFFVGQPELREKVKRLHQVDQRIFLRFHLNNLDYTGTKGYIQHRLHVAGIDNSSIFSQNTPELIFRATGGIPREINRVCKLALNFAFAQGAHEVAESDIQVILDDLKVQNG